MNNGTPNGETAVNEPVKNDAPTANNINLEHELVELRKKAEQAEMRARQLENEKQERVKQEELARQKQLEEQNEYRTLYEREKAAREAIEIDREEKETRAKLSLVQEKIFAEYPQEVKEIAEATGISLVSDDQTSIDSVKAKLELIKGKLGNNTSTRIAGNNGLGETNNGSNIERTEALKLSRNGDTDAFFKAVNTIPALDTMRKIAGYRQE